MSGEEVEQPGRDPIAIGLVFGGLVIIFWLVTPFIAKWLYPEMGSRGQFGDLFGSINALFSGLAFVGVTVAILLQKQELSLQREELRETRREMKRTADAQEAAQEALNKTIWAQSYKVALDILEKPDVVAARRAVWLYRNTILNYPYESWPQEAKDCAELVSRTFESVGSMVKKGLLPLDYVTRSSWSMPIAKQWHVLRDHNRFLRDDWADPYLGEDFDFLGQEATKYLDEKGLKVQFL